MKKLTFVGNRTAPGGVRVAKLARVPVLAMAGAVGLLLLVTSGRYGYFGDELYFLAAGRHLAWGYADQPPALPLLAHLVDALAPGSLVVFRLPATLATAAGVVVAALIARELGGGRHAQVLTAGTFAISGQLLGTGHYLATSTFDPLLWTVLCWLLVRWVRTRADGLLVWAGVVTAVAVNVKFLVLAFWLVAGICVLVFGPRGLLRRPLLWAGALIAAAGAAPTVVWQAAHGWPQLEMNAAISAEVEQVYGGRLMFLPGMLAGAGIVVGAVLLLYGVWRLLRSPELRAYRFLGAATAGLTAVFLATGGRSYYVAGMFAVCWAAAAVSLEAGAAARWWRWVATWPVYAVSALIAVPFALPVVPVSWLGRAPAPGFATAEIGWPDVAASVARAYRQVPDPARTAIVTGFYWHAAALDRFGRPLGLPEPYSGSRGYWDLGTPPEGSRDVLFVGDDPAVLAGHFAAITPAGRIDDGPGFGQGTALWLATGRAGPWSAVWPRMRDLGVGTG